MPNKFILTLDSSQIDCFLECPAKWHYSYQKRLQLTSDTVNVPMNSGSYGHKLLEIIYRARARGRSEDCALTEAFAYDIDKETCRCSHGAERHNIYPNFQCACGLIIPTNNGTGLCPICNVKQTTSCTSIGCPCQEFEPIEFPLSTLDRQFVRDRVLEYTMIEGTAIPELIPKSPEHVEVGFSHKLYEDQDKLYILEGRIDLIGQIANNCTEGWADHKFQSRERNLYLKSIQFRNYSLVTRMPIGVVNYIRFAKKVEKDKTFKREIISFSRAELISWESELIRIFAKVQNFIVNQQFPWFLDDSRNWSACAGKFGYPCEFTKLCENFSQPQLIQLIEASEYKTKPEWRPW
jgi:hypothetical protein